MIGLYAVFRLGVKAKLPATVKDFGVGAKFRNRFEFSKFDHSDLFRISDYGIGPRVLEILLFREKR